MTCSVDVEFRRSGLRAGRAALARFARATLAPAMADLGVGSGELTVLFCGDDEIRRLNRDFRGMDKPTDVLSFPASDDPDALRRETRPYLGDLAIALRYTAEHNLATATKPSSSPRVSKGYTPGTQRNVLLADEVALLLVHGLLHLLGWDHATKRDEARMWKEQARLLALARDVERPRIALARRSR